MTFAMVADQRFLSSAKALVGELTWDVQADPYQTLTVPSVADAESILKLMIRRGLEPPIANTLLDRFPDRPFERALLAWDIARGSLLGRDDGPLTQRLALELTPLEHFGGSGPVAIHRDGVEALIDAARPSDLAEPRFEDFDSLPSLAALIQLTQVRDNLDDMGEVLDTIIGHVKHLALAHFPSLALAFLQILWHRYQAQPVLDLLIEIGLDHGLLDAIPAMEGQDARAMEQQTYVLMRASMADYDVVTASRWHEGLSKHPAVRDSSDPSLVIARAELGLLQGKRFDAPSIELIEKIAPPGSGWRYAARVRDAIRIQNTPRAAELLIERSITMFGNDARLWGQAAHHGELRPDLLRLLSREIRYASHDVEAWRALAILVSDGEALDNEVDRRLKSQLNAGLV